MVLEGQQKRLDAASQAEQIVDSQVDAFMRKERSLASVDIIRGYRSHADEIKLAATEKAKRALLAGKDSEAVIDELAHALTNKLLHRPSNQLRKAAENGEQQVLDAARQLFNTDD